MERTVAQVVDDVLSEVAAERAARRARPTKRKPKASVLTDALSRKNDSRGTSRLIASIKVPK